jgi:hypothetical protein
MGVEGDIYEDDATAYYSVFYQAVASGRSLKDAEAQARAALRFNKVPLSKIPQLRSRQGVDPRKVLLVSSQTAHVTQSGRSMRRSRQGKAGSRTARASS